MEFIKTAIIFARILPSAFVSLSSFSFMLGDLEFFLHNEKNGIDIFVKSIEKP